MGTREQQRRRLNQMVTEARGQEPPAIDVDGISRHLVAEFRSAASSTAAARAARPPRPPAWRAAPVWAGVLALALLALVLRGVVFAPPVFDASPATDAPPDRRQTQLRRSGSVDAHWIDGRGLSVGEPLTAHGGELSIEHAGHARWTLAPGSEAQLAASSGALVRVVLAKGSLEAEVQPSALPESFVVQARGTEISVHGTRFEVRIEEQGRVAVSVSEGEVRVRPEGSRQGVVLASAMSGRFFAGSPIDGAEPSTAPPAAPGAPDGSPAGKLVRAPAQPNATLSESESVAPPPMAGEAGAAASQPSEAEATAAPGAERGAALAKVTERIQHCFARHTERPGEVTIEAATRLELEVEPSGSILEVRMNPPLAPVVEECVARELAVLDLGESPQGFRIHDEIRLRR